MKNHSEIKVGIFVLAGVVLFCVAIIMLGGTRTWFTRENEYVSQFETVEGLIPGAKVMLAGLQVGFVQTVDYDPQTKKVRVRATVERSYANLLRKDSTADIATQGVLGDKYLLLNAGTPDQPELENGGEVASRPPQNLGQFVTQGEQLLNSLNSIASTMDRIVKAIDKDKSKDAILTNVSETTKNLAQISAKVNQRLDQMPLKEITVNLNQILAKVNNGTGTLGALVNDPSLYDDLKAFTGGVNRNRIMRNLVRDSIKKSEK